MLSLELPFLLYLKHVYQTSVCCLCIVVVFSDWVRTIYICIPLDLDHIKKGVLSAAKIQTFTEDKVKNKSVR